MARANTRGVREDRDRAIADAVTRWADLKQCEEEHACIVRMAELVGELAVVLRELADQVETELPFEIVAGPRARLAEVQRRIGEAHATTSLDLVTPSMLAGVELDGPRAQRAATLRRQSFKAKSWAFWLTARAAQARPPSADKQDGAPVSVADEELFEWAAEHGIGLTEIATAAARATDDDPKMVLNRFKGARRRMRIRRERVRNPPRAAVS